ncbi:MAG: 5-carboxymethyl-2-hydroxymuconate semialdehyde dehydrogenase [Burkholderiales bacterium]|nr:5-carboxymethyl-2-hydroxymuconate semialdehyde dehydrogenase [Burkholderiales bacterium]
MITHLIDGRRVESPATFTTLNPANNEPIAEVASGGEAEIAAAVAAAKAAFPKWAGMAAPRRAKLITKLGELIEKDVHEIATLESTDTGQSFARTKNLLIPRAAENFHFFADMCQHVDGHTYPTNDHLNYTLYQPVGVFGLISPWNIPFMTATWKTAPCLAFGNTAVLKMSELSPLSADRLGQLALEAGIPAGVFNVVHGYGRTAGEALVRHPDVRGISFTGSTVTGNRIIERGGLKKYSMELGGKSPFIVFDDADFERALDAALVTIYGNNGESCTAGSRILVQDGIYERFVERFAERTNRIKVGDPLDETVNIGALISREHWNKVHGYIELGRTEGATVVTGGGRPENLPAHLANGNFIRPTVFADVDNRMRIAQEEIFGPVACLIRFTDEADALRIANDVPYGLSSYIFTENAGRAHRMARGIEAGLVFVNSQNVRDLRQPFGGIKASGTGREGGIYSYEAFLEVKNVCVSMGSHHIPRWGV